MGYLHRGHLSLIDAASERCDRVVTSIYVNPIQFGPSEDYQKYPRDIERDSRLAEEHGTAVLFTPPDSEIYPPDFQTSVTVEQLTRGLCGKSRPTHFRGVTTVVASLFNIVKPHIAFFGAKDAQQAIVIGRMARDLHFDVEIEVMPIVRDGDGLALSSRNDYLSPGQRRDALALSRSLFDARSAVENGERDATRLREGIENRLKAVPECRIDYVEIVNAENLEPLERIQGRVLIAAAIYIGPTRLIDNVTVDV